MRVLFISYNIYITNLSYLKHVNRNFLIMSLLQKMCDIHGVLVIVVQLERADSTWENKSEI